MLDKTSSGSSIECAFVYMVQRPTHTHPHTHTHTHTHTHHAHARASFLIAVGGYELSICGLFVVYLLLLVRISG